MGHMATAGSGTAIATSASCVYNAEMAGIKGREETFRQHGRCSESCGAGADRRPTEGPMPMTQEPE